MAELKLLTNYTVVTDDVPGDVSIVRDPREFVPIYVLRLPQISEATSIVLNKVKEKLISIVQVTTKEVLDPRSLDKIKENFKEKSNELLKKEFPAMPEKDISILTGFLIHDMLGLGAIEFLLKDDNLEEIVVNNSVEPVWAYHKIYGWLKTNVFVPTDIQIENYASLIGRKVGRQITTLNPLMDAHLLSGDRVNATLFPISSKGNTLTIRKFRRSPWTITELLENNTISNEVASLLWLAIEYEMSMIVSGGTASGKTTFLNVLMPFIPPNQRVISIEDTRELQLPDFLHWVPLTTREPNPEGKGEITMLDLLVNSLRMRPDRIVVGEIRRQREAEVLFEAIHTGHSVYATLHAETAEQTARRLTSPPINLPAEMIETLPLILVVYRHRRLGIRRVFQVAEVIGAIPKTNEVGLNILYAWRPRIDKIEKENESRRLFEQLQNYTGMTPDEIRHDMEEKQKVLSWITQHKITGLNNIGKIVCEYYINKQSILEMAEKNISPTKLLE
ncbi:MAG: ATPase, T2SS/T4P/T4SS family [Candidatus Parvarchaeota archaeon]|nr:ATPase, T2SS/T4P/T4SS family [Candidatus Jingweiarchaeum tengchongense]MCW1298338.1 ATPase, T2SS/T4P/T4SS family [Candidatus Jingweiarchaeum tengchongense]MCW1300686.1 ATPase, T2SS/T4P/T4SS family [Candidatus Jingweiarchaeum tengchongense]MCW1304725.1 ATPase, T2SS/T4P/T4SS family [Candidatus Jingweiarchaeum tengchongense]MCW1306161.1 ATPase, T2SS/T4P/T4SS family [Candidatus Jingweiarchaeum tengchongense]